MESAANLPQRVAQPAPQIIVSNGKTGLFSALDDKWKRRVATVGAILLIAGAGVVVVWLADKKVKQIRANKEEAKSFGVDRWATWAKQFKQAFDNDGWWGTDVPLVRQTMRAIPSQEDFKKVQDSYRVQYEGANLIHDLSDELTKMEYEEMLAIKNGKPLKSDGSQYAKVYDPIGWAKRLHAAMSYTWLGFLPGTDDKAILAVFQEFPNQQAFYNTAAVYKRLYGVSLWTDLDGDVSSYWSFDWRELLHKKPKK